MGTMRINQNISALNSYRNLSNTNTVMGKSLEKLSSGFRINRAADDAAGLVISQGLRAQVSGLRQATRNAQDGISVVQTAEGALNEVHSMLNRMRDLAVQSVNASNDDAARGAANNEITELKDEIGRIAEATKFGTQALLDGSFGATAATSIGTITGNTITPTLLDEVTITAGGTTYTAVLDASAKSGAELAQAIQNGIRSDMVLQGDEDLAAKFTVSSAVTDVGDAEITFDFELGDTETFVVAGDVVALNATSAAATGTAAEFQVGANAGEVIEVSGINLKSLADGIVGDVLSAGSATDFITAMDGAIADVSGFRGALGAKQNRFESAINNLQVTTENLAASESRIRDTDMALEMVSFTRHQILTQAGTAMLAQANQLPQQVLRLLG
ncbi:MAG: flagellin [Acidimicrobiia bacterium]|nr:flagellin [Acidimicrobiia bacterium]